jgi:hypothetical protein
MSSKSSQKLGLGGSYGKIKPERYQLLSIKAEDLWAFLVTIWLLRHDCAFKRVRDI